MRALNPAEIACCKAARCEWFRPITNLALSYDCCCHPEDFVNKDSGEPTCYKDSKAVNAITYEARNTETALPPKPKRAPGKDIHELALHEMTYILKDGDVIYYVTRVPGGWIYEAENDVISTLVFVPLSGE